MFQLSTKPFPKPVESNGDNTAKTIDTVTPELVIPKSSVIKEHRELPKAQYLEHLHEHATPSTAKEDVKTETSVKKVDTEKKLNVTIAGKKDKGTVSEDRTVEDTLKEEKKDVEENKSIEEYMWKSVVPAKIEDLPGLYARLAKLRLTGMLNNLYAELQIYLIWLSRLLT